MPISRAYEWAPQIIPFTSQMEIIVSDYYMNELIANSPKRFGKGSSKMKKTRIFYVALGSVVACLALLSVAVAASDDASVRAAYNDWVKAVTGGSADPVVKLYDDKAVLLATFGPKPLVGRSQLREYFVKFTALPRLKAETNESIIRIFGDTAVNSGLYTFKYEKDGKVVNVPARFSFTYRKDGDKWKIVDHHSSVVPPSME